MKSYQTKWTVKDFKAYILLYCANADFYESKEETKLIKSLVGKTHYAEIHKEFDKDNDFDRIQKIQAAAERFDFSAEKINELFDLIKKVFEIDGELDILEKNIYAGLKHLLK